MTSNGSDADLLLLVAARPHEAMAKAQAVLAGNPSLCEASVAHHAIGYVLRDFGDLDAAIGELRTALQLARRAGSAQRESDVLAALGNALIHRGQSRRGLAALNSSVTLVAGPAAGRALTMRSIDLWILGRHRDALDDLQRALRLLPPGDVIWRGRALTTRALVHLASGSSRRAERDLARAERLYATTNQELELAFTRHNRGLVAFRAGDLPAALTHLEEATGRYRALMVGVPDLAIDRCAVLLAAGLPAEALGEAEAALREGPAVRSQATKRAELLLTAARAALAAGQPRAAIDHAGSARQMFGAQQRAWWHAHATLLMVQAEWVAGLVSGRLLGRAVRTAAALETLASVEVTQAQLLAGRIALALDRGADADHHLRLAARDRHRRGPPLMRVQGWLAEALREDAAGERRRLFAACRRGLAVLDEHRLTLGASELRAQATAHGAELAALAQRAALTSGRPRTLLGWSERWRATALAAPPVRPVEDADLQAGLTALREVTGRLERAHAEGDPAAGLQREQRRLEAAVRARALRVPGQHQSVRQKFSIARLLAELGDARLIQIVNVGGELHLLVCGRGRVRHLPAGRAADAAREVEYARFALRRLAHGRAGAGRGAAPLEASGRRLEPVLLGAAARHLGDGPVIIVPPGRLHAVPWALLPCLRERAVSVAPSAQAWLRARASAPPRRAAPVLIRGPGLGAGGGEVPLLAEAYPGAALLSGGTATASRVLAALDGAPLAHIAAHGTFRADSPLFSSLRLDDGPLTVHDFERLRRAPHRMILSSCDSGLLAAAGADELLGLASTLAPLGTAGLVASVVPVNDRATVPLMLALHEHLGRGATLAEALRATRAGAGPDPVALATAWSFLALGPA